VRSGALAARCPERAAGGSHFLFVVPSWVSAMPIVSIGLRETACTTRRASCGCSRHRPVREIEKSLGENRSAATNSMSSRSTTGLRGSIRSSTSAGRPSLLAWTKPRRRRRGKQARTNHLGRLDARCSLPSDPARTAERSSLKSRTKAVRQGPPADERERCDR